MVLEHPAVVRLFKIRHFEFEFICCTNQSVRTVSFVGIYFPRATRSLGFRKRVMFRTADGHLYFPYVLIDALRLTPAIRQYQLVQMAAEAFRVRYVADAVLDGGTQLRIRSEFQTILNTPVTIEFDRVLEFAGTRSGKFLQAISDFVVQNKS